MCKQRTRIAFGVPSDGSPSAAAAWQRTKRRVPWPTLDRWHPGVLLWWTGGAKGAGHVAFTDDIPGLIWTVDFGRPGYWNRVSLVRLESEWRNLVRAGASLDIDGVQIRPDLPTPVKQPNVAAAIKATKKARDNARRPARRRALRRVLQALRRIKKGDYAA